MCSGVLLRFLLVIWCMSYASFKVPAEFVVPGDILEGIEDLCPGSRICGRGVARNSSYEKCCADCSCAEDCGLTNSCCFPELNKYNMTESDITSCILPSTNRFSLHISYQMIDTCPKSSLDASPTICDDRDLYFWGSLFPVWSPTAQRIYKNKVCADCHGIKDAIPWNAIVNCRTKKDTLHTIFTFMADFNHTDCKVNFYYPGNSNDVSSFECFSTPVSNCKQSFTDIYPGGPNMTASQVRKGCESGLYAPVFATGKAYLNVYCALCHASVFLERNCKNASRDEPDTRALASHFICILSMEVLNDPHLNFEPSFKPPCRPDQTNQNETECNAVVCPVGMVRHVDGNCVYFSQDWFVSEIVVCLRLLAYHPLPLEAVNEIAAYVANHNKLPPTVISPWGESWAVAYFMYPEDKDDLQGGPVREIVTSISLQTNKITPKNFFPRFMKILSKEWVLLYNQTKFKLVQDVMPFSKFAPSETSSSLVYPRWNILLEKANLSTPKAQEFNKVYKTDKGWTEKLTMNVESIPLQITKLLFCEQVELYPSQIKMHQYEFTKIIVHKTRTYFPDEFLEVEGRGRKTAHYRICAESVANGDSVSRSSCVLMDFLNMPLTFTILLFFSG